MKDFETIRNLVGETITETDLNTVDCYVRPQLGIFIPAAGPCGYASKPNHAHPSYMIVIYFDEHSEDTSQYPAEITSPGIAHSDSAGRHYYCVLIEKNYFEQRYMLYDRSVMIFSERPFGFCCDILKALNTFAFEYSKAMPNSHITLDAQAEIITHWIIRSLLGETLDMRAVSGDYAIARSQHFMEQHYGETITVAKLAALGNMSSSCFTRRFKKEIGITPIEYLIEIRMERAKILLRRKIIPITEIAIQCGFGSSAHLASAFQNKLGITPTQYRSKYRE